VDWQTDYSKVLSQSQKEGKPLLLFFEGSDWSGTAMKMKHEVLDTPAFQQKVGNRFIFMEVDFPKYSSLNETLALQNANLKKRFQIEQFPALLLLDKQERVIAQFGYSHENAEQLAENLLKILGDDEELRAGLNNIAAASSSQLQQLYHVAQDLGSVQEMEQILNAGLKLEDPYFYLEKYRLLVENDAMQSEMALSLRRKLMAFGPEKVLVNGQSIPFTVALIDFQEISQQNPESDLAATPLLEYLEAFSNQEQSNRWQIEMMLAEIYLNSGKLEEALRHAESGYASAPESKHEELAHSLDYIRSIQKMR